MYCQPDEEGRVDVSGKEYMELRRLIALADAVLEKTSRLDQRAKIAAKGTYRDLCLLRKLAMKVSSSLCDTIPTKRLQLIKKELAHTVCRIEVCTSRNTRRTGRGAAGCLSRLGWSRRRTSRITTRAGYGSTRRTQTATYGTGISTDWPCRLAGGRGRGSRQRNRGGTRHGQSDSL